MTTDQATADPPAATEAPPPAAQAKQARKKAEPVALHIVPATVRVTFEDLDEFMEHLILDAELVQDAIVRATTRQVPPPPVYSERRYELVAGYVCRGQIVELVQATGAFWGDGSTGGEDAAAQLAGWHETLRSTCEAGGLEVRGGRFGAL